MNNYVEVYKPDHPNSRQNGCVFEHVLVAESVLGRCLLVGEVVHHIDSDRGNNIPSNLMVFDSQESHARFHSGVYEYVGEIEGVFITHRKVQICLDCGSEFNTEHITLVKYCSPECSAKASRKCERPEKENLIILLHEYNFSEVGRMYGVSDNAIRKWCRGYGLSTKAKDYN